MAKTRLMYDMARLAFESDSTRCVTLMLDSVNSPALEIEDHEITDGYHNLSHHGKSPAKMAQLKVIDEWHMKLLGDLFDSLKGVSEDGQNLLDRTMVLYGSNLGNASTHVTTNLPVLFAGGGFRHGQHWPSAPNATTRSPTCSSACCSGWGSRPTGSPAPPEPCAASTWPDRQASLPFFVSLGETFASRLFEFGTGQDTCDGTAAVAAECAFGSVEFPGGNRPDADSLGAAVLLGRVLAAGSELAAIVARPVPAGRLDWSGADFLHDGPRLERGRAPPDGVHHILGLNVSNVTGKLAYTTALALIAFLCGTAQLNGVCKSLIHFEEPASDDGHDHHHGDDHGHDHGGSHLAVHHDHH